MDFEKEYKRKALEPIVNYIESVMASYSREELESRIKKALPEKESEDERIRKELIGYAELKLKYFTEANSKNDIDKKNQKWWKDVIAYLEKQKEQKYTNSEKPKEWSEDERIRKHCIWMLKGCLAMEDGLFDKEKVKADIAWLEKQKEQKPVEYLNKDKAYAIMTKLTNLSYSKLIPINSDEYKKLHEITSDVRDLLDYPIEQKPADWSEEDEKMHQALIHDLGVVCEKDYPDNVNLKKELDWFKSRRPQPKSIISDTDKSNLRDAPAIIRKSNHPFKENIALIIEKYL